MKFFKNTPIKFKIGVLIVIFLIMFFASYMYQYQQVLNISAALTDERCFQIEPVLAKKMDAATKYYNTYGSDTPADVVNVYLEDGIKYTMETVNLSEPWLNKTKEFVKSWEFQFFTDPVVKEGYYAYLDKMQADYLSNKAALTYMSNPSNEKLYKQVYESIAYQQEMGRILTIKNEAVKNHFDVRSLFAKRPQPKCTPKVDENPGIMIDEFKGPTG